MTLRVKLKALFYIVVYFFSSFFFMRISYSICMHKDIKVREYNTKKLTKFSLWIFLGILSIETLFLLKTIVLKWLQIQLSKSIDLDNTLSITKINIIIYKSFSWRFPRFPRHVTSKNKWRSIQSYDAYWVNLRKLLYYWARPIINSMFENM